MALFDNLFGTPPEYLTGLLGQDELSKLQSKANTTGLINTALAFIAQPRNMRYGSALPYLGKALMAGQQSGQGVYENALRGFETQQKIAELKRKQQQQEQLNTMLAGITDPNERLYAQLAPEQYVAGKVKPVAQESPFAKIDPSKFTKESIALFNQTKDYSTLEPVEKPQLTEAIKNFEYAKQQGYQGSFENWAKSLTPYQLAQLGIDKAQLDLAINESLYKYGTPQPQMPQSVTMQDVADTAKASGKTTQQVINDLKSRGITVRSK